MRQLAPICATVHGNRLNPPTHNTHTHTQSGVQTQLSTTRVTYVLEWIFERLWKSWSNESKTNRYVKSPCGPCTCKTTIVTRRSRTCRLPYPYISVGRNSRLPRTIPWNPNYWRTDNKGKKRIFHGLCQSVTRDNVDSTGGTGRTVHRMFRRSH